MSLEVFGSSGDEDRSEAMLRHDWCCDEDMTKWWKAWEPEVIYTYQEAAEMFEDWLFSED